MKNLFLGTFGLFIILSQVACSDGGSGAAASYAAANNCTIGGVNGSSASPVYGAAPATGAAGAAQAQVPCSLQNLSGVAANANLPTVAAAQVNPGAVTTAAANLNTAVKAQSVKVQAQLQALNSAEPPPVTTESITPSRAPASVAPSDIPTAIEGGGDIIR